ncbi:MAG: energy transducer TonB [Verrucomicrobiae bacterium]|nr:energy transducer TonB [Verrucomicrobiae bacterium]
MSESQKLFASLSGALVAHLLLFFLVIVLPGNSSIGSAAMRDRPREEGPREITVMMGDLMERLEREWLEKEKEETPPTPAEKLENAEPAPLPFVSTDLNAPEANAPEKARFESDRNTTAASRLRPNEELLQADTPTLAGDSPLPHLTLANRQYVEGPLGSLPSSPAQRQATEASQSASSPPVVPTPSLPSDSRQETDLIDPSEALPSPPVNGESGTVGAETLATRTPGEGSTAMAQGPEHDAEPRIVPGFEGKDSGEEATREKSYLLSSERTNAPILPDRSEGKDRLAAGSGSGREGKDEPDPLARETGEGAMAADLPTEAREGDPQEDEAPAEAVADSPPAKPTETVAAKPAEAKPAMNPADDSLFAPGFSPEERQNVINGSLAKEGEDAVDAMATPMGRYKKAVRDAISSKWHEYRRKNADFVTWGILKLEFTVDSSGRVRDLEITKNEANAMLAEFSLRAIRDASLPPMPAEVAKSVGAKGLVIQYDIIIY